MSVWNPPTDEEANQFVSLVTDTTRGPFFVFCADGLNRIGEMTAIYRVAHSNWSVEKALDEADGLGFNPYYYTLRNYVWDYARKFRPSAVPPTGRRVSPIEP
jgi:protein tyrosine/serine phosphatase